jgi:methylenetetrahydrofolate dehydrogenase (NADP+)/methenyltetrahydrofolate cyclohydrolase
MKPRLPLLKTNYFDGKAYALKKENDLRERVVELVKHGVTPKLISISVGGSIRNSLYLKLKQKAAERIGCKLLIRNFKASTKTSEIIGEIKLYNADDTVHGIMLQLPLPNVFLKKDRSAIINSIEKVKDVDGLRNDSAYLTPVVKAIIEVIKSASGNLAKDKEARVLLVGSQGFEGEKIFKILSEMGYSIEGADSKTKGLKTKALEADILISATGHAGLIRADMVKKGATLIDVGSPKGDIARAAYKIASFVSPVPGGVGPTTIACLLENLVEASKESRIQNPIGPAVRSLRP